MNANHFRIQSKSFVLTYSNCEQQNWQVFDKEALLQHIKDLGRMEPTSIAVCQEAHQDGSTHFHALVVYPRRKDIGNPLYFDYHGVHPTIEKCRSIEASLIYIKKDGNFLTFGPFRNANVFEVCQDMAKEEWVVYCLQSRPIIPFQYMDHIWKTVHPKVSENTITQLDPRCDGGTQVADLVFFDYPAHMYSSKVLVIEGPTGCGKTTWALKHAPKPALFVSHLDVLKNEFIKDYHQSIIFDDMSFLHIPRDAQLKIVEQRMPASIHCRYKNAEIPAGVPKIFTCNFYPFLEDAAIRRRVHHHHVVMPEEVRRPVAPPNEDYVIEL